jgi:hypothetical protein
MRKTISLDAGRLVGALTQGVLLGLLLAVAILELMSTSPSAQLFRYQGF